MSDSPLLKSVSRSFYLSLKWLPSAMRPSTCLAYLLARLSDTLADAPHIPTETRILALDHFQNALHGAPLPPWPTHLAQHLTHPGEALLLKRAQPLLLQLHQTPPDQQQLILEVLDIIISGQRHDVQHFAHASPTHLICLPDRAALDDYTWRVAGSVGEFWTKLAHLTLTPNFSTLPLHQLLPHAKNLGQALQRINIIRDLPTDLSQGRCYLPVADPTNPTQLMAEVQTQLQQTQIQLQSALPYARSLRSRRLRSASYLPALLAQHAHHQLQHATWPQLQTHLKIPRTTVYLSLLQSLLLPHPTTP